LYCLETENGGLFQTKPDILIKRQRQVVQVIDTKWKRIAAQVNDKKQGVSQADVYQMMAYGRLYNCSRLTLLYPHHAGLQCGEGMQASHRVTGSEHWLESATIDVAMREGVVERLFSLVGELNRPGVHGGQFV
jgi:5-methylcytosine-specific restriction enzyme subunit McrC